MSEHDETTGIETEPLRVLVVDDEAHLAAGLKLNFELEGFAATVAHTARAAGETLLQSEPFDVIVLDVMLPDLTGFDFCRRLREASNYTPVLMLTVRDSPGDRVLGLESGADDYLSKPFAFQELAARVRALARRRDWDLDQRPAAAHDVLRFGDAIVNFSTHEVTVAGKPLVLTRLELDLLRFLAQRPGKVHSRAELLEHVWQLRNYPNTRTVDNFIMRLRKHFEPNPRKPIYFLSVRSAGYKFAGRSIS